MPESANGPASGRLIPIWLAIGTLFALFFGAGAGILAWLSGEKIPLAILEGGGTFIATITVVILIIGLFPLNRP